MYKKQNNAKCEMIFLLRPAKEREYINMKELKVARGILVADMLITFYIVLGVKAFEISFFEHSFIDLIISWFPVIMLGIVAFIYSFYEIIGRIIRRKVVTWQKISIYWNNISWDYCGGINAT